jgi:hypothetical protein
MLAIVMIMLATSYDILSVIVIMVIMIFVIFALLKREPDPKTTLVCTRCLPL